MVEQLSRELGRIKSVEWSRKHKPFQAVYNTGESSNFSFEQLFTHFSLDDYFLPYRKRESSLCVFSLALLIVYYFFNVARQAMAFLTLGYQASLRVKSPSASVPINVSTYAKDYRLSPITTTFICCPQCSSYILCIWKLPKIPLPV